MGAAASLQGNFDGVCIEERTVQLYPKYMISDAVVDESDLESANVSWKMIVDDESPEYIRLKGTESFNKTSCLTWFFDQFYVINGVLDEASSSVYEDSMRIQIRALTGMINASLTMFKGHDLEKVTKVLNSIAKGHATKGVRAFQYPIVGEIFMLTMQHCLGAAYDEKVDLAWTKIFSVMLGIVLPAALREERLLEKEQQAKDLKEKKLEHQASTSFHKSSSKSGSVSPPHVKLRDIADSASEEKMQISDLQPEPEPSYITPRMTNIAKHEDDPPILLVSSSTVLLKRPHIPATHAPARAGSIHVRRASQGSIAAFALSPDAVIVIPEAVTLPPMETKGAFALDALETPGVSSKYF